MDVCASCKREIRVCEVCGGLLCTPGCADRARDGCTCDKDELLNDDEGEEADEVK